MNTLRVKACLMTCWCCQSAVDQDIERRPFEAGEYGQFSRDEDGISRSFLVELRSERKGTPSPIWVRAVQHDEIESFV